jgi:hypothetical protein
MSSITSPNYVDYPGTHGSFQALLELIIPPHSGYIFAVMVAQGGIMGYVKKGSIASLL